MKILNTPIVKRPTRNDATIPPAFRHTVAFNQKWLDAHRLGGHPWFILGSAPNPSMPETLPEDCIHAYVKFAGRGAKRHGFPDADVTLATSWDEARWADLNISRVLRVRNKSSWKVFAKRLKVKPSDNECDLLSHERDDYVLKAMRSRFRGVGEHVRPSSALTMIAFAIVHQIPEIIITGISLDQTGHEYNDLNSQRKHAPEDRAALEAVAAFHPHVSTTESSLAAATGLPLYQP
ncbi:hypothetical protein LQ948_18500 [Jiella sp. MQZ9-1]|uniref:Membrane-anchored protein n=1 Tax=Jiella flava TaxID=2816857 RepID=A0A939G277_9HYPH|nr:hypothetical protein [Jiella flava]MBO0664540.1 hypothetical protein [Jiella flava]MCD2473186.1 hypothetical protein [Jiella flava]